MSDALLIQANLREKIGTGPTRSLRRTGYVPAVIYSKGEASTLVVIAQKEAEMLYHKSQVSSVMINMKLGDKNYDVFPKQFNLHPVTNVVEHIDFMFVDEKATELRMNIPVKLKGKEKSIGIKKGGVVNIVSRILPCKVAKNKVPPCIEVDISDMDVGITVRLKDIVLPEGVTLMIKDLSQTFLRVTGKKKIVEEAEIKTPTAEGEEAGEAEEAASEEDKAATKDTEETKEKSAAPTAKNSEKQNKDKK